MGTGPDRGRAPRQRACGPSRDDGITGAAERWTVRSPRSWRRGDPPGCAWTSEARRATLPHMGEAAPRQEALARRIPRSRARIGGEARVRQRRALRDVWRHVRGAAPSPRTSADCSATRWASVDALALNSDMRIKIPAADRYVYPDGSVVCGRPEFEDERRDTLLNPVLVIEVLSDSSEGVRSRRQVRALPDRGVDPRRSSWRHRGLASRCSRARPTGGWVLRVYGPGARAALSSVGCRARRGRRVPGACSRPPTSESAVSAAPRIEPIHQRCSAGRPVRDEAVVAPSSPLQLPFPHGMPVENAPRMPPRCRGGSAARLDFHALPRILPAGESLSDGGTADARADVWGRHVPWIALTRNTGPCCSDRSIGSFTLFERVYEGSETVLYRGRRSGTARRSPSKIPRSSSRPPGISRGCGASSPSCGTRAR